MPNSEPGFGIYIHWPFCAQKCPYCDFNSHVRIKAPDIQRYLSAYRRELDYSASITGQQDAGSVTSIFFGGGTPSLMPPELVAGILDHIAALWSVAGNAEITLEANPGSVEAGRFKGYRTAGVNRVSLGVQSLDDAGLKRLGRVHTVAEARAALKIAQQTFERFSFDLIYARPGQTQQDWQHELTEALAMASDHISLYQLTIEPDTPYAALHAAGRLKTPKPEAARALYELTQDVCGRAGLPAYEVSNHARPGHESRHNMTYWRYGAYVGAGAGAHGRLVRAENGARIATTTQRVPEQWLAAVEELGHGYLEQQVLRPEEKADEMLLMGLRLLEGVDLRRLKAMTGLAPSSRAIAGLLEQGLLEPDAPAGRIVASPGGRMVLDWVVTRLSQSMQAVQHERPRHTQPTSAA